MKQPELYKKTVDILMNAYFNGTLVHSDCYACAVGNMVAANMGYMYYGVPNETYPCGKWVDYSLREVGYPGVWGWATVFITDFVDQQVIYPHNYFGDAKRQIDSTGYCWQDLAKIEKAFELAPKGESEEDWMFNGLMAVIAVLDEIHENNDPEITQQSKNKFKKNETISTI